MGGASSYDSRQTIIDSIVVAVGSTALTIMMHVLINFQALVETAIKMELLS